MKGIIGEVYCTNIAFVFSNDMAEFTETYGKGEFLLKARAFTG